MITVDGRCFCQECEERTGDIYRMVGYCLNCGAKPILMLFRAGDKARDLDCPTCRNYWSVKPQRLATEDEIPAAEAMPAEPRPLTGEDWARAHCPLERIHAELSIGQRCFCGFLSRPPTLTKELLERCCDDSRIGADDA